MVTSKVVLQKISELMLQGWAMTSEHCTRDNCNTVLLRSRSGEILCAACDFQAADPTESGDFHAEINFKVSSPPKPPVEKRPSPEEVSARLGQRLLKGWRMLADSCVECLTPYMSERNGIRKYCVACEAYEDELTQSSDPASGDVSQLLDSPKPSSSVPQSPVSKADTVGVTTTTTTGNPSSKSYYSFPQPTQLFSSPSPLASKLIESPPPKVIYASPKDPLPTSPVLNTASAKTGDSANTVSNTKAATADSTAILTATPEEAANAFDPSELEAALDEVRQGIAKDERFGPSARTLTSQSNTTNTTTAAPSSPSVPAGLRVEEAVPRSTPAKYIPKPTTSTTTTTPAATGTSPSKFFSSSILRSPTSGSAASASQLVPYTSASPRSVALLRPVYSGLPQSSALASSTILRSSPIHSPTASFSTLSSAITATPSALRSPTLSRTNLSRPFAETVPSATNAATFPTSPSAISMDHTASNRAQQAMADSIAALYTSPRRTLSRSRHQDSAAGASTANLSASVRKNLENLSRTINNAHTLQPSFGSRPLAESPVPQPTPQAPQQRTPASAVKNALPVSNGVAVLNAPDNWMDMTPEQLQAFVQQKTGKSVSVAKPEPVATVASNLAAPKAEAKTAQPAKTEPEPVLETPLEEVSQLVKKLVPGAKIEVSSDYGNLANNPNVEFIGNGAFAAPEPDEDQVQRLLKGLTVAYEEDGDKAASKPQEVAVSTPVQSATAPVIAPATAPATTSSSVLHPSQNKSAEQALLRALDRETAHILALEAKLEVGDCSVEVQEEMAHSSVRISQLTQGILALRNLDVHLL